MFRPSARITRAPSGADKCLCNIKQFQVNLSKDVCQRGIDPLEPAVGLPELASSQFMLKYAGSRAALPRIAGQFTPVRRPGTPALGARQREEFKGRAGMRNLMLLRMVAALLLVWSGPAAAYIGPGAGITAIGTAIALIGAIILAIVGFIWYPVKRLRARLRDRKKGPEEGDQAAPPT